MIVNVKTVSGARYEFNDDTMTWTRFHESEEIYGLEPDSIGSKITSGTLIEWPVIALGRRIMFDDTKVGVVYSTQVVSGFTDLEGT